MKCALPNVCWVGSEAYTKRAHTHTLKLIHIKGIFMRKRTKHDRKMMTNSIMLYRSYSINIGCDVVACCYCCCSMWMWNGWNKKDKKLKAHRYKHRENNYIINKKCVCGENVFCSLNLGLFVSIFLSPLVLSILLKENVSSTKQMR